MTLVEPKRRILKGSVYGVEEWKTMEILAFFVRLRG